MSIPDRSRPSLGPATETDRKDGWWVKAEWRQTDKDELTLLLGTVIAGVVYQGHDVSWWCAYTPAPDYSRQYTGSYYPTREEAQYALLASVRPKTEGV